MIHIAVYPRIQLIRKVALVVARIAHAWGSGCGVGAVVDVRVDAWVGLVGEVGVMMAGVAGAVGGAAGTHAG